MHAVKKLLIYVLLVAGGFSGTSSLAQGTYDGRVMLRSFIADRTAYTTGDTLTVLITELASISTTARTRLDTQEGSGVALTIPNHADRQWRAGLKQDFSGGGQIERGNRFIAKLSVRVERIDAQGNLYIRGEQEIAVNRERQHIRLSGVVRHEDLTADNTIESWRIRDAHIEFMGNGDLARQQRPSLISRIFSWLRFG